MNISKYFIIGVGVSVALWVVACGSASSGSDTTATDETPAVGDEEKPIAETTPAPEEKKEPQAQVSAQDIPSGGPCQTDADCVPATCCHPAACVDKANKPTCEGTMCTYDCRANTLDCGFGNCICKEGQCDVKWNPDALDKRKVE